MAIQQPPQQSGRPEVPQGNAVNSRFSGLAGVNGMKHLTELRLVPESSPPAVQLHEDATTRSVVVNHRLMAFWHTMIGKKVVMAITGVVLVGFVIAHMLGNLKIFAGPDEINAYSRFLREVGWPELGYGQLLWLVRIVLLVCVTLHITAAVQLTRMNRAARPIGYAAKRDIETTLAARTMRWGGALLVAFVVFHLLHLTGGVVGFGAGQFKPLAVYQNVVAAFAVWPIALFYVVAMGALCLHLDHGIWSLVQTLGWSTARNEATLKIISRVIAIVVFLGFTSVPVAVMTGWLR
jgi:succinate dehydrogenase cytochrome b subunit